MGKNKKEKRSRKRKKNGKKLEIYETDIRNTWSSSRTRIDWAPAGLSFSRDLFIYNFLSLRSNELWKTEDRRRSLAVFCGRLYFFRGEAWKPVCLRSEVVILNCSGKLASIKLDSPLRASASLSVYMGFRESFNERGTLAINNKSLILVLIYLPRIITCPFYLYVISLFNYVQVKQSCIVLRVRIGLSLPCRLHRKIFIRRYLYTLLCLLLRLTQTVALYLFNH